MVVLMSRFTPYVRDVFRYARPFTVVATLQTSRYSGVTLRAASYPALVKELRRRAPKLDHVQHPDTLEILDTGELSLEECIAASAQ